MSSSPNLFTPSPNPHILAWARLDCGLDLERAAKGAGVSSKRVTDWELGRAHPTTRQLISLAKAYRRPLSVFYQPSPPKAAPLAKEYRHLPRVPPGEESYELRTAVRRMLAMRINYGQLMDELSYERPNFRLATDLSQDPSFVAARLREATRVSVEEQSSWSTSWQAWRSWREALEQIGVVVFMFPDVPLEEARGIALFGDPPIAAVNTKEVPESRAFTALHETVHIMLANGKQESSALEDRHTSAEWETIERFAEAVAGHTLIPGPDLKAQANGVELDVDGVKRIARRFKATPLAVATRLREEQVMTWSQYRSWRTEWNAITAAMKPSRPFTTPVAKAIGRAGRTYAMLVLEALDANKISMPEASRYLGLRTTSFETLRQRIIKGAKDTKPDE